MTIERITDAARLEEIGPAWQVLFDRVPAAPPFASPAWLLPWWRNFAPGRVASVAVWDAGRLVALAPTYVEDGPTQSRLLPLGIGLSDHMDVLVDPACLREAGTALAAGIGAMRGTWACWSAEEALPKAAVMQLPEPAGCQSSQEDQSVSPVLRLPAPGEGLESVIPAGKRRKWRMAQSRVGRRDWRIATTSAATLAEELDHLFRLHGSRWQSRGEAGVLADPRVQAFHRAAAPGLLATGLLRFWTLRIDGTVAGAFYGFGRAKAAYAYIGGFDPAFAFESPGTLLMGAAINAAQAEGASMFHFLRGEEPYKFEWGAETCRLRRRTVVPA